MRCDSMLRMSHVRVCVLSSTYVLVPSFAKTFLHCTCLLVPTCYLPATYLLRLYLPSTCVHCSLPTRIVVGRYLRSFSHADVDIVRDATVLGCRDLARVVCVCVCMGGCMNVWVHECVGGLCIFVFAPATYLSVRDFFTCAPIIVLGSRGSPI
jgi:hypothetical protein